MAHRVTKVSLLLHVAESPVDDGAHGAEGLGARRHQAAVDGIRGFGRAGDEDHRPLGHVINLRQARSS